MTTRTDVVQDFNFSPRITTVQAPSTQIVAQDVVDTIRIIETQFEATTQKKLLNAEGKGSLGGGEFTPITATLQNDVIEFEARRTPAETGTITTPAVADVRGLIQLIDSAADFVAANVQPGSFVINWADGSITDVRRVVGTGQLECKALVNGSDNQFDSADAYSVFNIVQCTVDGGNVIAVDGVGADISAFLPSAFTQILTARSSSGTLQELNEVRLASFDNAAWYEAGSGNSGTDYPAGNRATPVDNWADAVAIANANNFDMINVRSGNATLTTGDDLTGFKIDGPGRLFGLLTIDAGAVVTNAQITNFEITGTLDSNCYINGCDLTMPLTFSGGLIEDCGIGAGTLTLAGSGQSEIINSHSDVAGLATFILDYGGAGRTLVVRGVLGGIQINNKTGSESVSLDIQGQIILDATVTGGTFRLSGNAKLTNNSSGTTLDTNALINQTTIAESVWNAAIATYLVAGSFGEFVSKKLLSVVKFLGLK